jgi:DNA-binding MarR family transcriptional regulator
MKFSPESDLVHQAVLMSESRGAMTIPDGADDDLLLEQRLVLALSTASRAIESACAPVLQELNLTHPQYLVMLALWEQSPRPGREICDLLPEPESLSPVLLQLEEAGYVQGGPVQGHEDPAEVSLTPKGVALYRRTLAISGTMLGRLGLSPEDAEGLYQSMPGSSRPTRLG